MKPAEKVRAGLQAGCTQQNLGLPSNRCMTTQELLKSCNDKQDTLHVGCNHVAAEQGARDAITSMPCTHDLDTPAHATAKLGHCWTQQTLLVQRNLCK